MHTTNCFALTITALLAACATTASTGDEARASASRVANGSSVLIGPDTPIAIGVAQSTTGPMRARGKSGAHFAFDGPALPPSARVLIQAHARYLTGEPAPTAAEGNADERATGEYDPASGRQHRDSAGHLSTLEAARAVAVESTDYNNE